MCPRRVYFLRLRTPVARLVYLEPGGCAQVQTPALGHLAPQTCVRGLRFATGVHGRVYGSVSGTGQWRCRCRRFSFVVRWVRARFLRGPGPQAVHLHTLVILEMKFRWVFDRLWVLFDGPWTHRKGLWILRGFRGRQTSGCAAKRARVTPGPGVGPKNQRNTSTPVRPGSDRDPAGVRGSIFRCFL